KSTAITSRCISSPNDWKWLTGDKISTTVSTGGPAVCLHIDTLTDVYHHHAETPTTRYD
ncbi:unnamed protein product, partial [Hymenolepis diminuta]